MKNNSGVKFDNGSQDHIRWLKAEIMALRQSISLTRSLLARMTPKNQQTAELLIETNEKKIADLNAIIARYRELDFNKGRL